MDEKSYRDLTKAAAAGKSPMAKFRAVSQLAVNVSFLEKKARMTMQKNKTHIPAPDTKMMKHGSTQDMKTRNLSVMSARSSQKSSIAEHADIKLKRIHQYNIDARKVLEDNKKQYHDEIRNRLDPLVERDHELMGVIPKDLCGKKIQRKFLELKQNQVERRIRNLIHEKTLHEWQLPKLKGDVKKYR